MKEIFKNIIQDFHHQDIATFYKRNFQIPTNSGKIVTLIGSRRTGKTFLMYQIINELIQIIPKQSIIYINFEDERLIDENLELGNIIDAYFELFPDNKNPLYLFFDEIQNIAGWEKFVRRMYDNYTKNIFITGSSSKLLSKEIATSLRGRTIAYEVFPLSFNEYLSFNKLDISDLHSTKSKAKIINIFKKYLQLGGFPETVFMNDEIRKKTLQTYLDVMIYKDIVERYKITNYTAIKYFIKKAIVNVSNRISINKLFNELKSLNIKLSKESLYEYVEFVKDCYLLYFVNIFDLSVIKQSMNEKKLYCIDNGLINSATFKLSKDYGRLLENLVFMELRRHEYEIYYHSGKFECDFIICREQDPFDAIQVVYQLDEVNKKREMEGLLEALKKYDLVKGTILTMEQEYNIETENKTITILPVWKWILHINN